MATSSQMGDGVQRVRVLGRAAARRDGQPPGRAGWAFAALLTARTVSASGTAFTQVAMAFAILSLGGTAASIGLVLGAAAVSQFAPLLVGGVLADRLPRRLLMQTCDVAAGLAQLAVSVLLIIGQARIWELLIAAVLVAAATAFSMPAAPALLAETIPADRLQRANGWLSIADSGAAFAGPLAAGLLVAAAGSGYAFLADAASFGLSAVLLARVPAGCRERAEAASFSAQLKKGWAEVASRRWYWLNLSSQSLYNLALSAVYVLGPVIALHRFGGAASWGIITAAMAVGAVVGGILVLRIRPRRPLVAGNLALVPGAALMFALAFSGRMLLVTAAALVTFAGTAFLNGVWQTTVQRHIPQDVMARVSSYDYLLSFATSPIGLAVAGPLALAFGPVAVLVTAAALIVVPSSLICLSGSVRRIRAEDSAET